MLQGWPRAVRALDGSEVWGDRRCPKDARNHFPSWRWLLFFLPRFEILRLQFFLVRENAQNDFQRFFLGSFKPFGQLFFDVFSPTGFKGALRLDTEDVWTFEGRALSLEWGGLVALHFSHYSNRIQTRLPPPSIPQAHMLALLCAHTCNAMPVGPRKKAPVDVRWRYP